MADDAELDELRFLTRALRAHVEWQAVTGATGFEAALHGSTSAQPSRDSAGEARPGVVSLVERPAPSVVALPVATSTGSNPARTLGIDDDRRRRLQQLAEEIRPCTRCGLSARRKQTVFARGTGSSGVCFV